MTTKIYNICALANSLTTAAKPRTATSALALSSRVITARTSCSMLTSTPLASRAKTAQAPSSSPCSPQRTATTTTADTHRLRITATRTSTRRTFLTQNSGIQTNLILLSLSNLLSLAPPSGRGFSFPPDFPSC